MVEIDKAEARDVGVKPLVWEPPVGGFHTARLPFGGKIEIMWDRSPRDGEHYVLHPGTLERQIFPTLKVAQAVAQALYDTALISALHPASPLGAVMEVPEVRAQSDAMQAAVAKAVEACAAIADAYADENILMASDSVLFDPVLSSKRGDILTRGDLVKSEELILDGAIHSAMFHAAQNIAAAIRARKGDAL